MTKPDTSIDAKILECAREEFSSKPFDKVSLRKICSEAGVTTGAFYKRYKNKEELFDAVVAPTLELLFTYGESTESFNYDQLDKCDMRYVWDNTTETQARIINALYDNYDDVRLLLCHAEGTRHANFLHDFVVDVTGMSHRFIREAHRRGIAPFVIDEEELHMLLTAYWATMVEPIVHGLSREQALRHSEMVAKLFDWTAVLGF